RSSTPFPYTTLFRSFGHRDHGTERRFDAREQECRACVAIAGRRSRCFPERISKPAQGLVADVERCFVDRSAAREALERKTDPARAYVLVKRRSELMLEPSTNPNRVHAGTRERRVRPAVVGCRVDLLQQRTNPVRCAFRLQWHTALTRTVSSFERRDRGRKEFDVLRFRLARRARGPTENARRAHGRN